MFGPRVFRQRVSIVGGGIAGLTLASAFDSSRFEVIVHEAQPHRTTGAALGLWPGSRRALAELGVALPAVAQDTSVRIHRLDGRPLLRLRTPAVAQVRRPELMAALAAAVPSSVRREDRAVTDPTQLDADLVIGADGVRSKVRGLVCPVSAERDSTPWVTLRGVQDFGRSGAWSDDPGAARAYTAREFWGPGRLFGDAPLAGGRYWFTAHRSDLGPEPLDVAEVLAEARTLFADAAPHVQAALADAASLGAGGERRDLLATRLWTTPALPRYRRDRYVLIGDAAHASLPNLGRGASDAILDAVSLARVLNEGGSLAAWEARRLPVTQAARAVASVGMRAATAGWWAAR